MLPYYEYRDEIFFIREQEDYKSFPAHLHISIELVYINKGHKKIKIGETQYLLNEGDIAVIFPNTVHSYIDYDEENGSENSTVITLIIFNHTQYFEFKERLSGIAATTPVVSKENIHDDVKYCIAALLKNFDKRESSRLASLYMQIIMERLFPYLGIVQNQNIMPKNLIGKIIMYISKNFREKISLEVLSKEFAVSKEHISRVFSETINMRLNEYINTMRIDYSKELLIATDLNILTIGMESGFENQQTFNRVFRELSGISPKEFRKKYKSTDDTHSKSYHGQ